MYDNTVTVFNKHINENGNVYWYPHVISGCYLMEDKTANIAKTGLDSADSVSLHIRYARSDGKVLVCDKEYVPPKEWLKLKDCDRKITFSKGDFFYSGEYPEAVINDEDYTSRQGGGFYDYMNREKDGVYLITNIGGPYTVIPHFEIGGK